MMRLTFSGLLLALLLRSLVEPSLADQKLVRLSSILVGSICDDGISSTAVGIRVSTNPIRELMLPTVQTPNITYATDLDFFVWDSARDGASLTFSVFESDGLSANEDSLGNVVVSFVSLNSTAQRLQTSQADSQCNNVDPGAVFFLTGAPLPPTQTPVAPQPNAPPAGQPADAPQSNQTAIAIGVGVSVGLVVLIAMVFLFICCCCPDELCEACGCSCDGGHLSCSWCDGSGDGGCSGDSGGGGCECNDCGGGGCDCGGGGGCDGNCC